MVQQRSLTLRPGNSLISPKLTLSLSFSTSIALRAVTQAKQLLALTAPVVLTKDEVKQSDRSHERRAPVDGDPALWRRTKVNGVLPPSDQGYRVLS